MIARSRSPLTVRTYGAARIACALGSDNQFTACAPLDFARWTRRMLAANSGERIPVSVASLPSFRIAERRTLINDEPSPLPSKDARQPLTVAFVRPGHRSRRYQSRNSPDANLYKRRVCSEGTLSRTSIFSLAHESSCGTTTSAFVIRFYLDPLLSHLFERPPIVCLARCSFGESSSGLHDYIRTSLRLPFLVPECGLVFIPGILLPCRKEFALHISLARQLSKEKLPWC